MKFGFITTEGGAYFKEALEEAVYGEEFKAKKVLQESVTQSPEGVHAFPATLSRYSPRKGGSTD